MASDHAMAIIEEERADLLANMARLRAERLEREQIEAADKAKAEKAAAAKERKAAASRAARLKTREKPLSASETGRAIRTKDKTSTIDKGRENGKSQSARPGAKRRHRLAEVNSSVE